MTCMKQEFCIHEKYCQRHIGQKFDSCILFSRNSKPMTNEEWLRSATTEQLAEWFGNWHSFSCVFCKHWRNGCVYNHNQVRCAIEEGKSNKELWLEWLKQPHTPKE